MKDMIVYNTRERKILQDIYLYSSDVEDAVNKEDWKYLVDIFGTKEP